MTICQGSEPSASRRPASRRLSLSLLVVLALLFIVVVAAYLRLYRLHTSPIWGDQSILLSIALDWVNWGKFPLAANKSSAGAMNPPLVVYLLALPMFVRQTVMAPLWFQALLSLTAVPLLYFLTARFFGRGAGLLAAWLVALNPWLIFYSRLIWNPSLTPLFAALLLTAVLLFLTTRHWAYLPLIFAALALVTQLHLASLVLVPVVVAILLLFGRRLWQGSWRRTLLLLAAGMALFLLLYTPYGLYERAVGFADVKALGGVLTGRQLSSQAFLTETAVNTASLLILKDLALGEGFRESQIAEWQTAVPPMSALFWGLRLLALAALVYGFVSPLRWRWMHRARPYPPLPDRETVLLVCALWVALPALFYLRHSQYLQNYFFLYLLPAACLLVAAFWGWLWGLAWNWFGRYGRVVGGTAVLLLVLPWLLWGGWQFWFFHTGLAMADRVNVWQQRAAGDVQQAAARLRDFHAAHPDCTITLLAEGYQHDSSPVGLLEPLLYPLDVALASAGRGFLLPGVCTLYLVTADDPVALRYLAQHGRLLTTLPTLHGDWTVHLVEGAAWAETGTGGTAVWQNGVELMGWQIGEGQPGQTMPLLLTWRITQTQPPLTDIHFFIHLLDAGGNLVAQDDAAIVHPVYWRVDDYLVSQFAVPLPPDLPPGVYTLHAGLYTWPDIQRIPLTNGESTIIIGRIDVGEVGE